MTNYTIAITSDTVCPWCYVGKNRLDSAIASHKRQHPDDTFAVSWHPFYLNPDAASSIDKQAFYVSKFGTQRTSMMQAHLARLGAQVGIKFAFGGKTGNTRDSHRVIQMGKAKGGDEGQGRVVEELFKAYFENEEDITSRGVLVRRAVAAGLDEAEVEDWLDSGKGGDEVDSEVKAARASFVGGVPNFRINGAYEIQGAEEPGTFLEVFKEIKDKGIGGGVVAGENTC
ncbi:thioredoxin-like protein [Polychaeton citri CBS 116435]|uniref:Thioredoxin-like protein n=1 Tax=Polychaeton citri CBS 116435 TaxID=1314669 RepID=A0A9P4Q5P7_9PEZI|nr:thioredoxin-like protein [Polychaeton citri CBS 116435]